MSGRLTLRQLTLSGSAHSATVTLQGRTVPAAVTRRPGEVVISLPRTTIGAERTLRVHLA